MNALAIVAAASLSAAAVTATGLTYLQYRAEIDPGIDPIVSASIPARPMPQPTDHGGVVFTVSNLGLSTVCVVERGNILTGRSRSFLAPPDCDQVWPGLSTAHNWTENGDGTVSLSDDQGYDVLLLGPAPGFDFAAIEPAGSDLTLLELR